MQLIYTIYKKTEKFLLYLNIISYMGIPIFFRNNNDDEIGIFNKDGISIRTIKEQNKYVKSAEYKKILKDLEELKVCKEKRHIREKVRMLNYNKYRHKLERKINSLTYIEGDITSNYFPIKVDRIPKITKDGQIINSKK